MLFWLICLVLTLLVASLLVRPMIWPKTDEGDNPDIAIYRAQLAEIDRDVARAVLAEDEAERARTEISRRLLAASKAAQGRTSTNSRSKGATLFVLVFLPTIAFVVYIGPAGIARWVGMPEDKIATQKEQFVLPLDRLMPRRMANAFDGRLNIPLFFEGIGAPGYGDLPLKARLAASDEMRANRPSQSALEAAVPPSPPIEVSKDYTDAVEQLRAIAPTRPDDLEAWRLLAFHEAELRNYGAAATAQAQVIAIKGEDAEVDDRIQMLDFMVVAAGGFISPEAEDVINDILNREEGNIAARYYLGALFNQTDRPDLAFRLWRDIVDAQSEGFHAASARRLIEDAAQRAGIIYTLPEVRGPSAEDIANAQNMSAEDQQAMIGQMVAGLADRLAEQGGSAAEWARLINAYGVLGDEQAARAVWTEATDVFGADPASMEILTQTARDLGFVE